jgi:hypothetical protein
MAAATASGTHVLALADGDARDARDGLHAELLHGLAALLLRAALLAAVARGLCVVLRGRRSGEGEGERGERRGERERFARALCPPEADGFSASRVLTVVVLLGADLDGVLVVDLLVVGRARCVVLQ